MRWYAGAVVLLLAALLLGMGLLAYAMYVLLALLVVSRLLARSWIAGLSATRECNRLSVDPGEKVAVVVTVHNAGRLPVPWVLLEDLLPRGPLVERPPRLRVLGNRLKVGMLPAGGRTSLLYQLQFDMRGYYQIGPLVLETGDLFGLHRRWRVTSDAHFVLVYPRVVPLENYDLASRRPIGEVRLAHRLYEDPTRISGVRYYEPGDPLNRVHWRATARTGTLHSKTYEPSTVAGGTIVLDFHAASYPTRNEPFRSELAVTCAASLANALYQLGEQVGLISNGRDAVDRIADEGWAHDYRSRRAARQSASMRETSDRLAPLMVQTRRGPEQLMRILETLARLERTDGLLMSQLIDETACRMPRDATVIAVLADVSDDTAWTLGSLHRRGFAVEAIVVDFEDYSAEESLGRLLAQRVSTRRIRDEAELVQLCAQRMVG